MISSDITAQKKIKENLGKKKPDGFWQVTNSRTIKGGGKTNPAPPSQGGWRRTGGIPKAQKQIRKDT